MIFSSNIFLFFFLPIFLIAYFVTPQKFRNYTLLLFSIVFYAYGAPDFVFLLVGECIINYYLVKAMGRCTDSVHTVSTKKKWLCALSIIMALGLLLYFKYANFFMENLNTILGWANHEPIGWMKVALPIGISFFTFQSITYTIDVYRGTTPPCQKLTDYVLYIMMFPQLIAGPIVNYNSVAAQLVERTSTMEDRVVGFYRFVIGLAKKVLIANTMALYADQVFGMNYGDLATGTAWIGILAYTFQIYFDFSGYSDMAIGLGKMMGFRFPENFNDPYTSRSVTEFWKRWHITLGNFIMNYLYIPLGGNRKGKGRMYFNLWVCFLLSGLWHGASWNFLVWGALHGLFICLDKLFLGKVMKKIGRVPSVLLTFLLVNLIWVFFRIEDFSLAWLLIKRMFAFEFTLLPFSANAQLYTTMIVAALFSFLTLTKFGQKVQEKVYFTEYTDIQHIAVWIVAAFAFVFCVAALNATDFSPFIYFRF
jgi:alginate O-acetyltransferase complex protein AlgI